MTVTSDGLPHLSLLAAADEIETNKPFTLTGHEALDLVPFQIILKMLRRDDGTTRCRVVGMCALLAEPARLLTHGGCETALLRSGHQQPLSGRRRVR
jgi:hypothetical protein